MIDIHSVSKSFVTRDADPVRALNDVSLEIYDNEFFTLLGPSGCGKTTLLRLIAGFEAPTTGAIRIAGSDVAALPPQRRPVNTVFQSYALFPHMSVAENVAFGLEMQNAPKALINERVKEALALVRLEALAARRPTQLSGGQQQRVAVARALAPKPSVLLLDEPLSALDLKLRKGMQSELKRLQRETGITFVLVTHDQEEALAMSDRIAVMRNGDVLQVGTPRDIYDNPQDRFVADFIGRVQSSPGAALGRDPAKTIVVGPSTSSSRRHPAMRKVTPEARSPPSPSSAPTRSTKSCWRRGQSCIRARAAVPCLRPATASSSTGHAMSSASWRTEMGPNRTWLLIAPAMLVIGIFMVLPLFLAVGYSFMTANPYGGVTAPATFDAYLQFLYQRDFDDSLVFLAELRADHPALGLSGRRHHLDLPGARPAGSLVHRLPDAGAAAHSPLRRHAAILDQHTDPHLLLDPDTARRRPGEWRVA